MIWICYLVDPTLKETPLGLVDADTYPAALKEAWRAWAITENAMQRRVSARILRDADRLPAGAVRQERVSALWSRAKEAGALIVAALAFSGDKWHAAFIVGDQRALLCACLHDRPDLAVACGRRRARRRGIRVMKEAVRG